MIMARSEVPSLWSKIGVLKFETVPSTRPMRFFAENWHTKCQGHCKKPLLRSGSDLPCPSSTTYYKLRYSEHLILKYIIYPSLSNSATSSTSFLGLVSIPQCFGANQKKAEVLGMIRPIATITCNTVMEREIFLRPFVPMLSYLNRLRASKRRMLH